MFRRKTTDAQAPEPSTEVSSQGKGRPTPTRKEAEAARKAALSGTGPADGSKSARKAARDADRAARYEARVALQSGDEKRMPPRDAGPVKAFVRDRVDARRSAGEFFIPIAVAVLVLGFVRIQWVQVVLLWSWAVMIVAVVLDSAWLIWRVRREAAAEFPEADPKVSVGRDERGHVVFGLKGISTYAVMRSLQLRRLRLPPPKVKANGQPVVPKAPR